MTPITTANDIEILTPVKYGTEFYCGYLPPWWAEKYHDSKSFDMLGFIATPINNRNIQSANIMDAEVLKECIFLSKKYQTSLYLVLNAKYYPNYIYQDIERYLQEVVSLGIHKVIACDLGLISFLEEKFPIVKVSVSCLNQVTNSAAVSFYIQHKNVERIVFPRHMAVNEVFSIANAFPAIQFEFFLFSNKCLYDDGNCRGVHIFTPICKDIFFRYFYGVNGTSLSEVVEKKLQTNAEQFQNWTQFELLYTEKNLCTPDFACSACSLIHLYKIPNIVSVKLSIRGHSLTERLEQVKMARCVINLAPQEDVLTIQKEMSRMYGKSTLCDSGMHCFMK